MPEVHAGSTSLDLQPIVLQEQQPYCRATRDASEQGRDEPWGRSPAGECTATGVGLCSRQTPTPVPRGPSRLNPGTVGFHPARQRDRGSSVWGSRDGEPWPCIPSTSRAARAGQGCPWGQDTCCRPHKRPPSSTTHPPGWRSSPWAQAADPASPSPSLQPLRAPIPPRGLLV